MLITKLLNNYLRYIGKLQVGQSMQKPHRRNSVVEWAEPWNNTRNKGSRNEEILNSTESKNSV
jgi:hypothetical protein